MGVVPHKQGLAPIPTPGGIEARPGNYYSRQTEDYWSPYMGGSYYVSRLLEEDLRAPSFTTSRGHPEKSTWCGTRIWRIAEVMLHSAVLYRELGIPPDESYALAVNYRGLEGRELYYSTRSWHVSLGRVCQSTVAMCTRKVTQDYVTSNLKGLV